MAIDSPFLASPSLSTLLCCRKRGREITHRYRFDFRLVSIHPASFITGKDPIFPNFLSGFADLAVFLSFLLLLSWFRVAFSLGFLFGVFYLFRIFERMHEFILHVLFCCSLLTGSGEF